MGKPRCVTVGIQAGLLGGFAVAALFFLLDLARLEPLATPYALGTTLLGPSSLAIDAPVLSELVAIVAFAGNLLAFTLLHFLAFSLLGIGAVWGCEECGISLNIGTGALFGLVICSLVFYGCVALGGGHVLAASPGPMSVAGGNLFAGAVMGGYTQLAGTGGSK